MNAPSNVLHLAKPSPDSALNQAKKVPIGETVLSRDKPLQAVVGFSAAICLFDSETSWCGLRHIMLSSSEGERRQEAMIHVDSALEDLFNSLGRAANLNTDRKSVGKRIKAKIFGGASNSELNHSFSEGHKSVVYAESWLRMRRIPIAAKCVGGIHLREIVLVPTVGIVYCRKQNIDNDLLVEEKSLLTAVRDVSNMIELF